MGSRADAQMARFKGWTNMSQKSRPTVRKPATKFANLRKKMEKTRIVSKINKTKKRGS